MLSTISIISRMIFQGRSLIMKLWNLREPILESGGRR
jgi:hypothetical protein